MIGKPYLLAVYELGFDEEIQCKQRRKYVSKVAQKAYNLGRSMAISGGIKTLTDDQILSMVADNDSQKLPGSKTD